MPNKTDLIRDRIITIVSDDFESFAIIMEQIEPLLEMRGIAASAAEVAGVLATVISEGYVDAYELSATQPKAVKAAYDPSRLAVGVQLPPSAPADLAAPS